MVSISGCDPLDPGSNPGTAIFFLGGKLCELSVMVRLQGGVRAM